MNSKFNLLFLFVKADDNKVQEFVERIGKDYFIESIGIKVYITNASVLTAMRRDNDKLIQSYSHLKLVTR